MRSPRAEDGVRHARRIVLALALASASTTASAPSGAEESPRAPSPEKRARAQGIAVVAEGDASAPAAALAHAVYRSALRPALLRDEEAQALVGAAPPAAPSPALSELIELRRGLRGRDATARAVAAQLSDRLHVEALLVVRQLDDGPAEASLFLASSRSFDAARYAPDLDEADADGGAFRQVTWSATVGSLVRTMGPVRQQTPATAGVWRSSETSKSTQPTPFFKSPWLWGALGAAAVVGGAFFLATRDTSPDSVRLNMELPR